MTSKTTWRRRQLSASCDLQRAHLHDLLNIHRQQIDSVAGQASRVAGLAMQGFRLYRVWKRTKTATASEAAGAPSKARLAIEVALAAVDCWRSPGKEK